MIVSISQAIVLIFAVAIGMFTLWGLYTPDSIKQLIESITGKHWGIVLMIAVRLLFGLALIVAAPESRFELIFQIIGGIAIVAGIGLVFIGRDRLTRLVAWWFELLNPPVIRVWLLFAGAFAGFLIYGVA